MAIMEISVVPLGTGGTSLSSYVADCIRVLKKARIPFELSAMGTNVEGDLKKLVGIALKCTRFHSRGSTTCCHHPQDR